MAAVGAAGKLAELENGGTVTVLEKMQKPGRKIMVSGKGRCNFTNVKNWEDFGEHVCNGASFIAPAFHNLTPENVVEFFRANGMRSVVERGDRAFPQSYKSGDVVDTLVRACMLRGVKIVNGCAVDEVERVPKGFRLHCTVTTVKEFRRRDDDGRGKNKPVRSETKVEKEVYLCSKLIIATGGLSYPWTGSDGDGYGWCKAFGHDVTDCLPSLTAIVPEGYKDLSGNGDDDSRAGRTNPLPNSYPVLKGHIERITPLSQMGDLLCGNSLDNVRITLYVDGNEVQDEFGDLEFTDGGIEGPIGFQVSRRAVRAIVNGSKVSVSLDLKPAVEYEKLNADVHGRWEDVLQDPRSKGAPFRKLFRIMLGKLIPWDLTLGFLHCNPQVSVDTLASALKAWKFDIAGFVGFERAVITSGGVGLDGVVAKTLESKKMPSMYLCGEMLDFDCDTGGYNMHSAFATGYLAGQSAAKSFCAVAEDSETQ